MREADIFVLVSNYEGWGRAAVEAMAAGVPVIMTNVGLAGELLRHEYNGLIIPVGDEKALARAVDVLMSDEKLRQKIIANALETVKYLPSWEEYLNNYIHLWRKCYENSRYHTHLQRKR